jgi:hypothetical protein
MKNLLNRKAIEMWKQKVTNLNTGTFCKISDLPVEWRKNKKEMEKSGSSQSSPDLIVIGLVFEDL